MIMSWALSMMASAIPGRPLRFSGACEEDKDASMVVWFAVIRGEAGSGR
jgi:hypothetical protein